MRGFGGAFPDYAKVEQTTLPRGRRRGNRFRYLRNFSFMYSFSMTSIDMIVMNYHFWDNSGEIVWVFPEKKQITCLGLPAVMMVHFQIKGVGIRSITVRREVRRCSRRSIFSPVRTCWLDREKKVQNLRCIFMVWFKQSVFRNLMTGVVFHRQF